MAIDSKKIIIKNGLWAILGKFTNLFGVLLVGILIARYLGPKDYGTMSYIISYISIFSIISEFGLEYIEIRDMSKDTRKANLIMGTTLLIRITMATISFIAAVLIGLCLPETKQIIPLIIIYATIIFPTVANTFRNFFFARLSNESAVKSEIARTCIGIVIKILLLLFNAALPLFIVAMAFDFFLVAIGYIITFVKEGYSVCELSYDRETRKSLIKDAFPLLISASAVMIYQRIDQVMIGSILDVSAVGYFAVAVRLVDVVMSIPTIMVQVITPVLVRKKEMDLMNYKDYRLKFLSLTLWISVLISFVATLFAYPMVKYSFGEKYFASIPVLQILVWKIVGMSMSASTGQLIVIDGIQKWAVFRNIISCILCVCLNATLIPQYGIVGAALSSVITLLFTSFFANLFIPAYRSLFYEQIQAFYKGPYIFIKQIIMSYE